MYRLTPVKDTLQIVPRTFQSERCSSVIPTLQQIRVGRTETFWMWPLKRSGSFVGYRVSTILVFTRAAGWTYRGAAVVQRYNWKQKKYRALKFPGRPALHALSEVMDTILGVPKCFTNLHTKNLDCGLGAKNKTILGKHWSIWLVLFQRCWTGRKAYDAAYVWINIHLQVLQSGKRPLSAGCTMAWPCCQNIPLDTETRRGLGVRQIQEWWTLARNLPLLHPLLHPLQNQDFYLIAGKPLEVIFGPVRSRPGRWQPLLSDDHVRFRNWAWHLACALGFVAICVCRVLDGFSIFKYST